MEKEPGSDIVELIIAVDLDPKNPEEPINVTSVDKSEGMGKGQCPKCAKLMKMMAKMDPEMDAVVNSKLSDDEKISALDKLANAEKGEAEDEADSFDKATKSPKERYGMPDAPKDTFKPRERSFGGDKPKFGGDDEGDFEPRKKSGGFGGARDRAFGDFHGAPDRGGFSKKPQDDEDFSDGGADEDQEDSFGKKKRW